MTSLVKNLLAALLRIEMTIAFVTLSVMTIALAADVIGREVFQSGLFGAVKVSVFALIYCAMAGFGIATATGGHLRPKFLDGLLNERLDGPATRAGNVASALILIVLAYGGWKMVAFTREIGDSDLTLGIFIWPIQLALPIGFAISALRHLIYAIYPEEVPAGGAFAE